MRKITLLGISLLFSFMGQAQNTQLESLLAEYQTLSKTPYPMSYHFNSEERAILRDHFSSQASVIEPKSSVLNNVTLFGADVGGIEDGAGQGQVVSFETDTPTDPLTFLGLSLNLLNGDFESCGEINPLNLDQAFVLTFEGNLFSLDLTTGIYTGLGVINPPEGEIWTGLEVDPETNIYYGISGNFLLPPANTATLSTIDIDGLTSTEVGPMDDVETPISIVTDGEGNFYVQDLGTEESTEVDDSLFSIDIETGRTTLIGVLGFDATRGQDMEWDAATGTLWLAGFNFVANAAELRTVDPTTGLTTLVDRIGDNPDIQISWASIRNEFTGELSVDDNNLVNVSIFPNPTEGILNINSAAPMSQVVIYNNLGQNVATYNANNLQDFSVDTNGIANGLYVIELTTPSGVVTEKF